MGGYGSGGHNRTHGQIEKHKRIDSFHFKNLFKGDKYIHYKERVAFPVYGERFVYFPQSRDAAMQTVTGEWQSIELSFVRNVSNSETMFFMCPVCKGRVRYLYKRYNQWLCRKCAGLNYASQQQSGIEAMIYRMEHIVENELQYYHWGSEHPHTAIYELQHVEKPRYMRRVKYNRLMREWKELQRTVVIKLLK